MPQYLIERNVPGAGRLTKSATGSEIFDSAVIAKITRARFHFGFGISF